MKLLSSRCNAVLTEVNGKIPTDFRIGGFHSCQVLLHQEGTCDSLAAQTP